MATSTFTSSCQSDSLNTYIYLAGLQSACKPVACGPYYGDYTTVTCSGATLKPSSTPVSAPVLLPTPYPTPSPILASSQAPVSSPVLLPTVVPTSTPSKTASPTPYPSVYLTPAPISGGQVTSGYAILASYSNTDTSCSSNIMKAEIFVLGVCQQLTSGSYASMFFYADFNGYIYANAYTNTACRYYTIEQLRIVTIPPLVTPPLVTPPPP